MAEAKVSGNLDGFSCFICSNLLRDPVSVPCGHSFCMTCINSHWSIEFCRGLYICPVCKQRFNRRPILGQNLMLTEMVERLKKTRVPERTLAGPEYVECDICTGRKHKAVKSCLDCVASYCEVHFNLHNVVNSNSTHKVTETRYDLRKRICSRHNKLQNVLCCTEERAVCIECAVSECSGHKTITFAKKRAQQQVSASFGSFCIYFFFIWDAQCLCMCKIKEGEISLSNFLWEQIHRRKWREFRV